MNLQEAKAIAQKILEGRAHAKEKAALRAFIELHSDKDQLIDALFPEREFWDQEEGPLPEGMEQRVLTNILYPQERAAPLTLPKGRFSVKRLTAISSAAAAILVICFFTYHMVKKSPGREASRPLYTSTAVTAGHLKNMVLADGTHITLNGGSSLRWPTNFTGKTREVYLIGEAFFEVAKDSLNPFIIHTPFLSATVLGTSFNVRSGSREEMSEVAVATGKVKVEVNGHHAAPHDTAYVTPGQGVAYHVNDTAGLRKKQVNINTIGTWKNHWFFYDQTNLQDILADLERSYNPHFKVIDPAVLTCTYNATFKNISTDAILKTLTLMGNVKFRKKNNLIEVTGKACR